MPTAASPALRLSTAQARAVVLAVQGLAGEPLPGIVATLEQAGLLRTLGGIEVYLALRARLQDEPAAARLQAEPPACRLDC